MEPTTKTKAIAAFITSAAGMVAVLFAVNIDWLSPEIVAGLAAAAVYCVTWFFPNKPVNPVE